MSRNQGALNEGAKVSKLLLNLKQQEGEYNALQTAYNSLDAVLNGTEDFSLQLEDYCTTDEILLLTKASEMLDKMQTEALTQALQTATKISRTK